MYRSPPPCFQNIKLFFVQMFEKVILWYNFSAKKVKHNFIYLFYDPRDFI